MGIAAKIAALIACGEAADRAEAIEQLCDMGEISWARAERMIAREAKR